MDKNALDDKREDEILLNLKIKLPRNLEAEIIILPLAIKDEKYVYPSVGLSSYYGYMLSKQNTILK